MRDATALAVPWLLTVDDLLYDADRHETRTPGGVLVPHVTSVLTAVGVTTDFAVLGSLADRIEENIELARQRGRAVHMDCHAYDDDDLARETVHVTVAPYVEAWATARRLLGLTPVAHGRERRLYHPIQFYTGIQDGVFIRASQRERILVDMKTGDPDDAAAHLQTAAYQEAWTLMHPDQPIAERWAIWLRPGRKVPYTVVNYSARQDAWADAGKWAAALCTYNEQPARRQRVR